MTPLHYHQPQLADALELAGSLARHIDQLTDALVLLADETDELTQQQMAELLGANSASTVNHRLARLRGTRQRSTRAPTGREAERVEQAQSTLVDLLARGEIYLAERDATEPADTDDGRRRIGWTDHEFVWLHPVTTRHELNQRGQHWTSQSLSQALATAGVIDTRTSHDGTVRRSVAVRVGRPPTVVSAWQLDARWLRTTTPDTPRHTVRELDTAAEHYEALAADLEPDTTTAEQTDDLRAIADASDAGRAGGGDLHESVQIARTNGRSWNQIAVALGVSRQAARQRFGEKTTD